MNVKYSFNNNLTFCIPFFGDHNERFTNLHYVLMYLDQHFCDYEILLGLVQDEDERIIKATNSADLFKNLYILKQNFKKFSKNEIFHRTKLLNFLYNQADSEYVFNYDADVLFNVHQYIKSMELIQSNQFKFVYPFTDKVFRVWNSLKRNILTCDGQIGDSIIPHTFYRGEGKYGFYDYQENKGTILKDNKHHDLYGSALLCNVDELHRCGGENEKFIGWGFEDHERFYRLNLLSNQSIARVAGCVYHLEHDRNDQSSKDNPFYEINRLEWEKIKKMDEIELKEYMYI